MAAARVAAAAEQPRQESTSTATVGGPKKKKPRLSSDQGSPDLNPGKPVTKSAKRRRKPAGGKPAEAKRGRASSAPDDEMAEMVQPTRINPARGGGARQWYGHAGDAYALTSSSDNSDSERPEPPPAASTRLLGNDPHRRPDHEHSDRDAGPWLVGQKIAVWWQGESEWYVGVVVTWDSSDGSAFIEYDDGDEDWRELRAQGRPAELKAAGAAAVAGIAAERETDGVVAWPWRIVSGSSTNR